MQKIPLNQEQYQSCQGIGQQPLTAFPEAYVAVSCCGQESQIPVTQLLKGHEKLTVAEVIEKMKCGRCGGPAQTAYLQRYPYREGSIYHNPAMPGWACQISGRQDAK
jgi:hypothetical protein